MGCAGCRDVHVVCRTREGGEPSRMMSAPTPMGSPGRDPAQLQLARDMVLPALCQAFGAALARFDDALFDRAGNAGSSQLLFLDAMRELRRRREDIAGAFSGHLQRAWDALASGEPMSAESTLSGPAEDGLSLLADRKSTRLNSSHSQI